MELYGVKKTRIKLPEGETLFTEGDPSDCAFLMESGTVEIYKNIDGEDRLLTEVGGGELLGEMGLIDGLPRSATVVTNSDVLLDRIEKSDFLREIEENSRFAAEVMGILVRRLRNQTPAEGSPTLISSGEDISNEREPSELGREKTEDTASGPTGGDEDATEGEKTLREIPKTPEAAASGSVRPELRLQQAAADGRVILPMVLGDGDGGITAMLADRLRNCYGLTVIGLEKTVGKGGSFHDPVLMQKAAAKARGILAEKDAAVLIHAMVDDPRSEDGMISLRIVNRWLDEEGRLGGISIFDQIELPVAFEGATADLFAALVLASTQMAGEDTAKAMANMLPPNLQAALENSAIPQSCYSKQQYVRMLTCYGNASSKTSILTRSPEWLSEAATAYRLASQLCDSDYPIERATIHLHLAVVLSSMGERGRSLDNLESAAESCRQATALLDPKVTPIQSLTAFARLGAIHYRSAVVNCTTESCRLGVEAFQAALAISDRKSLPDQWADVMNGLGQTLQLFGRLSHKTDLLKWSIKVCLSALEVRSRDHNPLGWARTQNNIGTSRYLLGSLSEDRDQLTLAIESFLGAETVFHERHQASMVELVRRNRFAAERELEELS